MSLFININGKLQPANEAAVHVNNRAFRYGYGLFETMLVRENKIRLSELHWDRLINGMTLLDIQAPGYFREDLHEQVLRTVGKNKLEKLCRIRLQVNAGEGGYFDDGHFTASYVIEAFPLEPSILALNEAGLVVGISNVIKNTGAYAHLKTCNALPYALAARQSKRSQWNDALLLNERGNLVESTIANLFWIKDGDIFTPPLSEGCVDGVMRRHMMNIIPQWGMSLYEQAGEPALLDAADAVFITNSIRGIRWVRTVNSVEYAAENISALHLRLLKSL